MRRGTHTPLEHALFALTAACALLWTSSAAPAPLGDFTFPRSPPRDMLPGPAFDSHDYLRRQGGVTFWGVAQPVDATVRVTGLRYDALAADGERLVVELSTPDAVTVRGALPDWQLVPIAEFAAGDRNEVFTLFGELQDPLEETEWREAGYSLMTFSPPLRDTLFGLRMFHADVLILSDASTDLPRHTGGYLLGSGESPPDRTANRAALAALPYGEFQSYVISDYMQAVTFAASAGRLVLTGDPYWYFWRYAVDEAEMETVVAAAYAAANQQLNAEYAADAGTMTPAELDAKYTQAYVDARGASIVDAIVSPQVLEPLPALGSALFARRDLLEQVNPEVYRALRALMRYAAFFRHVRRELPGVYAAFMGELSAVAVTPCVRTPGAYIQQAELRLPARALECSAPIPDAGVPHDGATGAVDSGSPPGPDPDPVSDPDPGPDPDPDPDPANPDPDLDPVPDQDPVPDPAAPDPGPDPAPDPGPSVSPDGGSAAQPPASGAGGESAAKPGDRMVAMSPITVDRADAKTMQRGDAPQPDGPTAATADRDQGGCACRATGASGARGGAVWLLAFGLLCWRWARIRVRVAR